MEIDDKTRMTVAECLATATYHFAKGDLYSLNYCKELLGEVMGFVDSNLESKGVPKDEPSPLTLPPIAS
jgi:hypothetical protein